LCDENTELFGITATWIYIYHSILICKFYFFSKLKYSLRNLPQGFNANFEFRILLIFSVDEDFSNSGLGRLTPRRIICIYT
jgi:hypothetical protein